MHRHSGWECPIKLYTLTSTNILRKYMSVVDAPATIIGSMVRRKELGSFPTPLLYVSGTRWFQDCAAGHDSSTQKSDEVVPMGMDSDRQIYDCK